MKSRMRVPAVIAVAGVLLLLVGCSPPAYPDRHGEREPEDALPAELVSEQYDTSTSLLVATHDGVDVFLVWPAGTEFENQGAPCLAVGPPDAMAGCGGPSLTIEGPSGMKYMLHPPERPLDEGWIALTENVSVREP